MVWGWMVDSQRYLDEAEREKVQYAQELKEYQQTEAFQITSAKIHDKRIKKGEGRTLFFAYSWCPVSYNMYVFFFFRRCQH